MLWILLNQMLHTGGNFCQYFWAVLSKTPMLSFKIKRNKLTLWSLDFGQKIKFFFFWKNPNSRPRRYFFYSYYQKIHKEKFFRWVEVRFEKEVSEVRKKGKTNVLNLDSGEEITIFIFKKCLLVPEEAIFLATKTCTNECSSSWSESDLKNKSLKYEKSKPNVWSLDLGTKNLKLIQKKHVCPTGGKFFVWLLPKDAKREALWIDENHSWRRSL